MKRIERLKYFAIGLVAVALIGIDAAPVIAADAQAAADNAVELKVKILKVPAKAGVSFNDAVESLKLRANTRNFKFVGHSPLSKEIEAQTGKPALRAEIFSFCDALTARQFIDVSLNFAAFLPCRVAILEDIDKKIWIVSMMMDMSWLNSGKGGPPVPGKLQERAREIIDIMNDMIQAAASGDI
jgi:uncharacterized protein (DUF302 family)